MRNLIKKIIKENFQGDSNPLNLKHIDTWHEGQNKAVENKTEEAVKLMSQAAEEAKAYAQENQDAGVAGDYYYYLGTVAWLQKDYKKVEDYANHKYVKSTGNDSVLKRLLQNKDKNYKQAYNN